MTQEDKEYKEFQMAENLRRAGYTVLPPAVVDDNVLTDFEDKLLATCLLFGAVPDEERIDFVKDSAPELINIIKTE